VDPPPAGGADAVAQVVGEAEHRQAVAGDDAQPGPERSVGAGEGDCDPAQAGIEEFVAEQGDAVQGDHRQGGQRERLVQGPVVALVRVLALRAHHQPKANAGAGEQQRCAAGGAAGDPEKVGGDVHRLTADDLVA
jgi:hypothetical protein